MLARLAVVALLALAGARPTPAQIPDGTHVVASRFAAVPLTRLFRVDATTGQVAALPRFASDALPPLAIEIDPFDRHLVVALDLGGGRSRVVRLAPFGAALAEVALVPDLAGRVTQLGIGGPDYLVVAVDAPAGGLFRMPRRGGALTLVRAQPNLAALHVFGIHGQAAVLGWTGRPGTAAPDSGTALIGVFTGQAVFGTSTFPNPTGRETTGIVDVTAGTQRQLLSFADGTFAMVTPGPVLAPIAAVPQPPPGACAAMKRNDFALRGTVVGGAVHPFVAEIDLSGAFTIRSQAVPGDPVDFAHALTANAYALPMTTPCGPIALAQVSSGPPRPGTTIVAEARGGASGTPAIFVAGFDDFFFGLLPFAIPGGCLLHVNPDAVVWHVFDPVSTARQSLAIPPGPAFLGAMLFTQWLHAGAALSTTEAFAIHVGT